MVKANAYGVGDSLIVGELLDLGVKNFGVARVSEGERLRRLFPQQQFQILVFAPLCASFIESYIQSSLTPVVGSAEDLRILSTLSSEDQNSLEGVHVKFDLGMTRLGFSFFEADTVTETLKSLNIKVLGVCGHFSQASDITNIDSKETEGLEELTSLSKLFGINQELVHAPNSEALSSGSFVVGSRPGLSLYGLSDSKELVAGLEPALSLYAPLVHSRSVKKGTRVSYGGAWVSDVDTQVGVLLIGYADGLPRGLSGKISLFNDGDTFKQVGRICMDYTMIDIGPSKSPKIGQMYTFFDVKHNPRALSDWAESLGCISYELLVGLGDRLLRRVV